MWQHRGAGIRTFCPIRLHTCQTPVPWLGLQWQNWPLFTTFQPSAQHAEPSFSGCCRLAPVTAEFPQKAHIVVTAGLGFNRSREPLFCPPCRHTVVLLYCYVQPSWHPAHHSVILMMPSAILDHCQIPTSSSRKGYELCPTHLVLLTPNVVSGSRSAVNKCLFYERMNRWMFTMKKTHFKVIRM